MTVEPNWHTFFFLLFAGLACAFAVAVVITSNIVRMALYLIMSLGATSGLFFLAGADFVGAMQLLIYVGGTLVLLIFGVMLTAQGPFISMKTSGGDWIVAFLLSGCLLAFLIPAAFSVPDWRGRGASRADAPPADLVQHDTATRLGMGLLGARVDRLEERPEHLKDGMSGYLLPFEIVSVHLLVVLIGAAYLARTKRRASNARQLG
ncbi:MAG: NADH-quinone oxidoreductase subunit J [Pirellulales bacterium]